MQSLADHVSPIIGILSVVFTLLVSAIGFIMYRVWKNIDKLNDKMDEFLKAHYECQRSLPITYMAKSEFHDFILEWRKFLEQRSKDWQDLWEAFNSHTHEGNPGPVVRRK